MKKLLFVLVVLSMFVPSQASAKIKVGAALKKVAHVAAAPVKHPQSAVKQVGVAFGTSFLAGIESVGVVIEGVGTVVTKVGGYITTVGGVLAGGQ
jgi:hypothetical protein